jgi:hypothetical protein
LQTRERIVDLGVKIFLALFKTVPESLRLFPFADADGKPVMSELKKHGLKTFVAFSDVIDGLDNADKTAQIYEHLVRCALNTTHRLYWPCLTGCLLGRCWVANCVRLRPVPTVLLRS